jgi:cytochrome c-type biogenesis protein CcmH
MKHLLLILLLVIPVATHAVEPDEMLQDPVLEQRAREISKQLRCVVCQNQDIDSSNAGVARDLRIVVRERLSAGDDDKAVISYVRARYGDYVLMRPPFNPQTFALWFAPPLMALIALVVGFTILSRKSGKRKTAGLTEAEEAEVAKFVESHKTGDDD